MVYGKSRRNRAIRALFEILRGGKKRQGVGLVQLSIRSFFPDRSVDGIRTWEIPSCLTHDPHRRTLWLFACSSVSRSMVSVYSRVRSTTNLEQHVTKCHFSTAGMSCSSGLMIRLDYL